MRKLLCALAASCFASGSAAAVEASWFGEFKIYASSATCAYSSVGTKAAVVFRPEVGTNGPGSRFSIFRRNTAVNLELPDGNFSRTFKTVNVSAITEYAFPIDDHVTQVRFTKVWPATITTNTEAIQITGQIKGYESLATNCVVSFRMALLKRAD
jgi:hypothetical protein